MDNEREFQGQGNEANMSASKTCNAAPNEESQRGGQRSGLDVATTRPQTELNQAAEIGVSLPKTDAAVLQTAVESQQSVAARSEVGSVPAAPSSDPATRTGYAEREASGGDNGPALQAGKELPAGQHEGSRTPVTDSHGRTANDPDSAGVKLTALVQPSGELAAPETMTDNPSYGPFADIEQTRDKPRRRWVWWVVVGVGVLGLVIGPIGVWLTTVWFGGLAQLQSAMAEADAIYPHWRWEDLIRQREQVPPEENAWPLIEQIAARYRANPHTYTTVESYSLRDSWLRYRVQHPNRQLPEELEQSFRKWLEADSMLPALIEQLCRYRRAQAPVARLADDPWCTPLRDVDHARVAHYACRIVHDYYLQKGLDRQAEIVLLGSWKVVEAEDDSLFAVGQLAGVSLQRLAVGNLERHLAMREISPEVRKEIRRLLEKRLERHSQRALLVIRGERALTYEDHKCIQDGRVKWWQFVERVSCTPLHRTEPPDWLLRVGKFVTEEVPRAAVVGISYVYQHRFHAELLQYQNRLEKAAVKSEEDLERELETIKKDLEKRNDLRWLSQITDVLAFFQPHYRTFDALKSARLYLEAAKAGLAAEEFRVEHGRLPHDWNELVPRYLPSIPHESFAGGPFQFKTTADGIVIYSVGTDRKDDGGDPERDIVFRVYHRDKRGLPPVPFKPSAHP
jgi:hypothetical protein